MDNNNEKCPNCGASFIQKEECCKYCGTKNPNYVKPQSKPSFFSPASNNTSSAEKKEKFSSNQIIILVILLIFAPCIGIIYLIYLCTRK